MTSAPSLGSVVIPAHNEAGVIGRCLDALFAGTAPGELEVVVACNGCSDGTAGAARATGHPVVVLDLAEPSKPAALRAGEAVVSGFPRLYLDADVILHGSAARGVLDRLRHGALAARPPIRYDTTRSSAAVRRYYSARAGVPSVMRSLWGAGVCGVSARGRGRFGAFPDVTADDLWLDRRFAPTEIEIVECDPVLVAAPRRSADLARVLRRTYRGNAESQTAGGDDRAREITRSTMRELVRLGMRGPGPAMDAVTYAAFATGARLALALRPPVAGAVGLWERDDSSRAR